MYWDPNEEELPASNGKSNLDEPDLNGHMVHRIGRNHNGSGLPKSQDKQQQHCNDFQKQHKSDTYFSHLWQLAKDGNKEALNKLSLLIAPELQRIAMVLLSKERADHTLTTNALINELYLRLLGSDLVTINDRNHFLALAAKRMRFILIDYARKKNNQKNNNGQKPSTLDENIYARAVSTHKDIDSIIDIDKALTELEKIHSGWAKVVELRYFGGCQFSEISEIMDINKRRAERYWARARTWLFNYLKGMD